MKYHLCKPLGFFLVMFSGAALAGGGLSQPPPAAEMASVLVPVSALPDGLEMPDVALGDSGTIFLLPTNLPDRPEMPDAMVMSDGTKVTTLKQWRQRREEMKQILEFYELGHAPPPPGNVSGQELQSRNVLAGAAQFRLVHLKFGPGEKLGFDVAIFTPAKGGPFPTIINPSFNATPGVVVTNPPARAPGGAVDPETAARGFSNVLTRGYAVLTYRYTQCGSDDTNFAQSAFFPAYPNYSWGVLSAWAWGLSRCVDYVETQPFADTNRLIALGHSRLGRLVLVATAFDERIALGAPAASCGAGSGAYRFCGPGRGGGEGVEDLMRKFPWYFVPQFKEFGSQVQKLPFEAYWYIALAAPRPWIDAEGTTDTLCLPSAIRRSVLAARPVYEFLGVSAGRVGVNYGEHGHALAPGDWTAVLDFADQQLRGIDHQRKFDQFPP
jgi:hypothetical protein